MPFWNAGGGADLARIVGGRSLTPALKQSFLSQEKPGRMENS